MSAHRATFQPLPARRNDAGFSFIELLAYMAIAALLILAAIPQFNNYRGNARDASTMSDVKNMAIAVEAWTINNPGTLYPHVRSNWAGVNDNVVFLDTLGVKLSDGTRLWFADQTTETPGRSYCIIAYNDNGRKYAKELESANLRVTYNSGTGGLGRPCW